MPNIHDKLIEIITSSDYLPLDTEALYEAVFAVLEHSDSPSDDYEDYLDALDDLEDAGAIVTTKRGKIIAAESSSLIKGTFRATQRGFGFVMPDPEYARRCSGDIFIAAEDTMAALNDDRVMAVVTENTRRSSRSGDSKNPEGRILRIIERANETVVGTLMRFSTRQRRGAPSFYVEPDDRKLNFTIIVEDMGNVDAAPGTKVVVELTDFPYLEYGKLSAAYGKVTELFGDADSKEANYSAILHENQIRTEFDRSVLEEAKAVSEEPISADGRLDLRDKTIITIDSAEAKDLDDAVSVERTDEGWLLGVHIADVSHYVREGSTIDGEAFMRGTSVYFTDKVVPMLPFELSNGCCSLTSGHDRLALSALISLDNEGEIVGCELHESIISTAVRGVYSELNDIAERGNDSDFCEKYSAVLTEDSDGHTVFGDMLELYGILENKSRRRGALDLDSNEAKLILDEDGNVCDIVKREQGLTEKLIEQYMLCANEAVASWLYWQDIPCVYRTHDDPSSEKLQVFGVFAYNLGLNILPLRTKVIRASALQQIMDEAAKKDVKSVASIVMLRSLAKAKYSSGCSPHFGLAIEKYCHFTSPIRRYPDLAVHRIIKDVLHGNASGERLAELAAFAERTAETSSECELRAQQAERAIDELYKAIYMSDHVGETFEAVISSVTSFGFFAQLDNTCEGLVHTTTLDGYFTYNEQLMTLSCGHRVYRLGDRVTVRLDAVDVTARKLSFVVSQ